jgi:protein-tyrosine phosphatase
MKANLFWIPGPWSGKLAISARPRGGEWLDDEICGWRRTGLDVMVSLLEPNEVTELGLAREGESAASNGIGFRSFPVPDRGVPSSTQDAIALLKDIVKALDNGKTVAVHCRQGVGRSGLIAAGVLMISGLNAKTAIEVVGTARGETVPETAAQHRWLERLVSERLAEAV